MSASVTYPGERPANSSLTLYTNRIEPSLVASVQSETGSGAELSASITQTTDWDGRTAWTVAGVTVDEAGTGYSPGDLVQVAMAGGATNTAGGFGSYILVDTVGDDGEILTVQIWDGGFFAADGGVIESVVVNDGGQFFENLVTGITITDPGIYYKQIYTVTSEPVPLPNCKTLPSPITFSAPSITGRVEGSDVAGTKSYPQQGQSYNTWQRFFTELLVTAKINRACGQPSIDIDFT